MLLLSKSGLSRDELNLGLFVVRMEMEVFMESINPESIMGAYFPDYDLDGVVARLDSSITSRR